MTDRQTKTLNILVVEDDRDDFYLTEDALMAVEGQPYRASWCGSYGDAEQQLLEQNFDLALVDYQIGVKTGLDFISRVGPLYPHCPMILLTGLRSAELDRQAQAAGAADYIPKEILTSELIDRAIRYTRQHTDRWSLLNSILTNVSSGVIAIDDENHEPLIWNELALASLDVQKSFGFTFKQNVAERLQALGYPDSLPQEFTNQAGSVFEVKESKVDGIGRVIAFHDVSLRNEVELRLRHSVAEAEQANHLKSRFLSLMSHELRTPISGVLGMVRVMERSELGSDQRSALETIKRSGEGLIRIINDVLDISKVEAGAMEIDEMEYDLVEAVDEVVKLLAPNALAKGVELTAFVDPDLWHTQNGDPYRINQILTNLVGNAIKFTSDGSVFVYVHLIERNGNPTIRFEVTDTGAGISAEDKKTLFQWFQQLKGSNSNHSAGTGLGLALSKQLVTLMRGDIGCESEVGQGSTFWFEIPGTEPSGAVARLEKKRLASIAESDLLVVSPNPALRRVASLTCEAMGGRVIFAERGAEAFAALRDAKVGHVIVDSDGYAGSHSKLAVAMRSLSANKECGIWLLQDRNQSARAKDCPYTGMLQRPFTQRTIKRIFVDEETVEEKLYDQEADSAESSRQLRILMAEDNPTNQMLARVVLAEAGYELTFANDGLEAVDLAQSGKFDVVLMDVNMPGIDGLEATRRIRALEVGATLPIVGVTAESYGASYYKEAGMDDCLSKPVDWDKLLGLLKQFEGAAAQGKSAAMSKRPVAAASN